MVFGSIDKNKELLKKYNYVFHGIMDKIKETNSDDCYYEKDYLKIRFNSNDGLPLNKPLKFHLMTIPIRYVFEEEVKFSPQVFLDDTLYELIGYERIDIGRTNKSKECLLCHYWNFLDKNFSYGPCLCDECYNIMHKSIKFKNLLMLKKAYTEFFSAYE